MQVAGEGGGHGGPPLVLVPVVGGRGRGARATGAHSIAVLGSGAEGATFEGETTGQWRGGGGFHNRIEFCWSRYSWNWPGSRQSILRH